MKVFGFAFPLFCLAVSTFASAQTTALSNHPAELLKGSQAGVYVTSTDGSLGSTPEVLVRGLNSVFGSNEPLWVVDGVQMSSQEGMRYLSAYDIGSIKVLKDISETAAYGDKGANGVIVVTTAKPESAREELKLSTNAGISIPQTPGFTPAFDHSHHLSLGKDDVGSHYYVSMHYRGLNGVCGENSNNGGVMFKYNSNPGRTVGFGTLFAGSMGKGKSYSVEDPVFGESSLMMTKRYPNMFQDTFEGWISDYDNDDKRYHAMGDVWLKVNIIKELSIKLNGGVDFDKLEKGIWYGVGTAKGKAANGIAIITDDAALAYNADLTLEYDRYFGVDHHLDASLSGIADGRRSSWSRMTGKDFFSHELRYNGLTIMGSTAPVCTYSNVLSTIGAEGKVSYVYSDIAGVSAHLRWQKCLYPSASAWVDFRNLFFRESAAVGSLKLYGGYGVAGRQQYLPYDAISTAITAEYVTAPDDAKAFFHAMDIMKSSEANVGVSMEMFSGRLAFDAKVYSKTTEDTFNEYCTGNSGLTYWTRTDERTVFSRTAVIAAQGVELTVSGVPLKTAEANLRISGFASLSNNEYKSIPADCYRGNAVAGDFICNVKVAGGELGSIAGYVPGVNPDQRVILGSSMPSVLAGISLGGRAGHFFFDVSADGAFGRSIADLNAMFAAGQTKLTDQFVRKSVLLRISKVSLGYGFDFGKAFLKGLRINVEAGNFCKTDMNCFGVSAGSAGIDWGAFPSLANAVLGVVMKF